MIERLVSCNALQLNYMNCIHAVWAILFVCFGFYLALMCCLYNRTDPVENASEETWNGVCVQKQHGGNVRFYFLLASRRCTELENVIRHIWQKWTQEQDYPT